MDAYTVWIPDAVSQILQLDNTAEARGVELVGQRRRGFGFQEGVRGTRDRLLLIAEECEDTAAGRLYDWEGVTAHYPACRAAAARIREAVGHG